METKLFLSLFPKFEINISDAEFLKWYSVGSNSWLERNNFPKGSTEVLRKQGACLEFKCIQHFAEFANLYTVNGEPCGDFNLSALEGTCFSRFGGNVDTKLTHISNGVVGAVNYYLDPAKSGAYVNKFLEYSKQEVDCVQVWNKIGTVKGVFAVPLMFLPLRENGKIRFADCAVFHPDAVDPFQKCTGITPQLLIGD